MIVQLTAAILFLVVFYCWRREVCDLRKNNYKRNDEINRLATELKSEMCKANDACSQRYKFVHSTLDEMKPKLHYLDIETNKRVDEIGDLLKKRGEAVDTHFSDVYEYIRALVGNKKVKTKGSVSVEKIQSESVPKKRRGRPPKSGIIKRS